MMCRTYVFIWFLSLTVSGVSLGMLSVTRAMGVSGKFSCGTMKRVIVTSICTGFVVGTGYALARAMMTPQRLCQIDENPGPTVHIINKIGFALQVQTTLMLFRAREERLYGELYTHFRTYRRPYSIETRKSNSTQVMNLSHSWNETVILVYRTKGELTALLLSIIVGVPVIVIGSTGNVAVCWIVIAVKKLRTPANFQLVSIAIVDLLTCAIVMPMVVYSNIHHLVFDTNIFLIDRTRMMCRTYVFIWFLSLTVSGVSLGMLSVTRAMGVSGKFSCGTMKRVIVTSICTGFVVGTGYALARVMMTPERLCQIDEDPAPMVHIINKIGFAMVCGTLFMVSVSYGYVFSLKYRQRKTAKLLVQNCSTVNKRDLATIRICFLLVTVYFITYLPIGVFAYLHGIRAIPYNLYYSRLVYSSSYCGSMINPIIYCLMSRKFRQHLCCSGQEKKTGAGSKQTSTQRTQVSSSGKDSRPAEQNIRETSIIATISSSVVDNIVGEMVPAKLTGVDNQALDVD
ncbi:adenosine receptor A2b-like [Ptychodera flava]|uniref:adenosine receptor A2b-like n=1 Tax=Ptychodera flava TaxID=63121 RepID=UPI00396A3A8E